MTRTRRVGLSVSGEWRAVVLGVDGVVSNEITKKKVEFFKYYVQPTWAENWL